MKTVFKAIRFIVAAPVGIPLVVLGAVVGKVFPPAAYLSILGLLLLGLQVNVQ